MNSVRTLHSAAMEYYDLGKIAKAKGNDSTYKDYFDKAYAIAIEAALRSQVELKDDDPLKTIYLRSVSWIAYDTGNYLEAKLWAEIALTMTPNDYEKESLHRLLQKVQQIKIPTVSNTVLLGQVISFNLENKHLIIKDTISSNMQIIQLDDSFLQKIIPFFIGKLVEIELVSSLKTTPFVLKNIRLAA